MDRPTVEEMVRRLAEPLAGALGGRTGVGGVSLLCPLGSVADAVMKLLVRDAAGRRRAVVLCSPPVSPALVEGALARAREAQSTLGHSLGAVILTPLAEGRVFGLSFAVLPYCKPLSDFSPLWRFQRALLRPAVFEWLWRITAHTVADVEPGNVDGRFVEPLRHVASLKAMSDPVRAAAGRAADGLDQGAWTPRFVLTHMDLWKGNILIDVTCARAAARRWCDRFVVIDWPAAQIHGYAMFDLIRLARSMQLSRRQLRTEMERHCRVLDCEPSHAPTHLLAALGHIGMCLEHFPLKRYVRMSEACYTTLQSVLE